MIPTGKATAGRDLKKESVSEIGTTPVGVQSGKVPGRTREIFLEMSALTWFGKWEIMPPSVVSRDSAEA